MNCSLAVLGRIVLEDSLSRIADIDGLDSSLSPSRVNDELKKSGRYPQPMWRQIQAWLDIGNSAAHGKFDEYTVDQVKGMLDGVSLFIGSEF